MPPVVTVGSLPDPNRQIRQAWGESLREHMDVLGMSRKVLRQRLSERGVKVSLQTIDNWVNGVYAPRTSTQVALAALLQVPTNRLFSLPNGAP